MAVMLEYTPHIPCAFDIGFFSSEIGPSALFQAYKLIKNGEKQGKYQEDICIALREKFGEKNPEMQVLH